MKPVPLHHVFDYTDVDRAFWEEHLEGWVPRRIIDAHVHMTDTRFRLKELTPEQRRQFWVSEVAEPITADALQRCTETVYPARQVSFVAMGFPDLSWDIDPANDYVIEQCRRRGWQGLIVLRPEWSAQELAARLDQPGVLGVKPYYTMIPGDADHQESSIFDCLPHRALEVLNDRRAWVTLHVPRAERLGHPDNLREIREIRRAYPNVVLVIAHLGRSYTEPHAREGLEPLADEDGLYFDNSAVLNPAVHRLALKVIGPHRILYGTDSPVFYMRGRRTWEGRTYINHTSYDFHFNRGRHEPPQVEAAYTLYLYEALKALKDVTEELGLDRSQVEAIFHDNARDLIDSILAAKTSRRKN